MAESEEEVKSLLMKLKEESEKAGLKLKIQKTKFMSCGPVTSWQIDGERVETVVEFIFLGSKTTIDGDCSHEIKRCLLEGNGTPLQYSRGAWKAAVHGVAKSRTRLSDFTFTFHFHALEKEMATHSSVLAWRIPWMEKPGRLQSMGLHRVGHD